MKQQPEELTLTIPESARYLRISVQTAYRLARQGALPAYRIGKLVRLRRVDLDDYISAGGGTVRLQPRKRPLTAASMPGRESAS